MLIKLNGKGVDNYVINTDRIIKITERIWTVILYDKGDGTTEEIEVRDSLEDILNMISK